MRGRTAGMLRPVNVRYRFVARIDYDDRHGPLLQTSISGALAPATDRALLRAFVEQRRMKISGEYKPCYRVVA